MSVRQSSRSSRPHRRLTLLAAACACSTLGCTAAALAQAPSTPVQPAGPPASATSELVQPLLHSGLAPTVASIAPAHGFTTGATAVTITGTNFAKDAHVEIGGRASSVTVLSETEITAVTQAASAGSVEVIVADSHGSSTAGPSYTYVQPPVPTVTAITPSEGPAAANTTVTITGSGFQPGAGVQIGGRASAVRVLSESEITAVTPSVAAGPAEVTVTDDGLSSSAGPNFTYLAPRASTPSPPVLDPVTPVAPSGSSSDPRGEAVSCAPTCGSAPGPASRLSVMGWGEDGHGALGAGYKGAARGPVSTLVANARAVVAGSSSYALLENGTVDAWGDNTFGQLGNGGHRSSPVPAPVSGISDAVAVAAGGAHAMALLANGTVITWGGNTYGMLGNGTSGKGHEVGDANPVLVPGLSGVVAIAAGGADDVALLANGTLEAWGENKSGQLGDGTRAEKDVPTPVKGLSDVSSVAIGGDPSIGGHLLAVLRNGTVMAVGGNLAGQLGDASTADSSTPVAVRGLSGVSSVSADLTHSMALLANGTVAVWGNNAYGQLGVSATGEVCGSYPCSRVPLVLGLTNVTAVSAGFRFSLAVSGGRPYSWGWNQHHELGSASTIGNSTPTPVGQLQQVSVIAAGEFHSLAMLTGSTPPPALEVAPAINALSLHWLPGEAPQQRWMVQWRPVGQHASWSPIVYLPLSARTYTLSNLPAQPYEVLVRNSCFGSRVITGTPLAGAA